MDLFVSEPELTFERPKRASVQLDENPNNWGRQVLVELFRVLPQISEYAPQVMFVKLDKEQGTGFGVVAISSETNTALRAVRPGSSAPKAYIPIVVKGSMLAPLDLLMTPTGRFLPLTEQRLREALFRPATFDLVTDDWGDVSLYNMFYPPGRSDLDHGAGIAPGGSSTGVTVMHGPGMKYSMLEGIVPTVLRPDLDHVTRTVESVPGLLKTASNLTFLGGLQVLARAEGNPEVSPTDLMKTAAGIPERDVYQIGWSPLHEQYWVKSAARSCYYNDSPSYFSRHDALKMAGEEVIRKVDTSGTVTISAPKAAPGVVDPREESWGVVEEAGIYKVHSMSGKTMTGWVLPKLMDTDGVLVPMTVFTNGGVAAVQDQVVGSRVSTGADLPADSVKGTGLFYCGSGTSIAATVPLSVLGGEASAEGHNTYLVRTLTGGDSRIHLIPGLKALVASGGEYFAPADTHFLALSDERAVSLASEVGQIKSASAGSTIQLWGDGSDFAIRFYEMPKLASVTSPMLNREDAIWTLCVAGLDAQDAHNKVSEASYGRSIHIPAEDVKLAADLLHEVSEPAKLASQEVRKLRQDLIKEAAVLPDVLTVDSVLSLGFINSENVRMFISRLPYLEKALHHVCELLLASRIGLSEIPEMAAARCVRGLDSTIQGLKSLMLRDVDERAT